jgi:hypothetical protein
MRLLLALLICLVASQAGMSQKFIEKLRFEASEARQGVAVDKEHIYIINNHKIVKRSKKDFSTIESWDGGEDGVIQHLNSGIVINGKLYCANSNYPEIPMASSIEIFDVETLEHVDNISFGIFLGSCTWLDYRDGFWWVMFAHYGNKAQQVNRDVSWSTLVKMDNEFRQLESWIFPSDLIDEIKPYSLSGGVAVGNKQFFCTGHHNYEIYVLDIPEMGFTLKWTNTILSPFRGQGIAVDQDSPNLFYGINRDSKEVIIAELENFDK